MLPLHYASHMPWQIRPNPPPARAQQSPMMSSQKTFMAARPLTRKTYLSPETRAKQLAALPTGISSKDPIRTLPLPQTGACRANLRA
ncbi:uncharacterized protein P884DRAFT_263590 [Thermothelomyces heterothallicus CBS 202.75]|uniref:uncharacterized protein n=1 Tax=Thermothelomyces heterothallicus CBS 202.75 TaxID=1149848 RepID=UPI00374437A1